MNVFISLERSQGLFGAYHAVLFSRPLLVLLLLSHGVLNRKPVVGCSVGRCPGVAPSYSLAFRWQQAKTNTLILPVSHMVNCLYHFIKRSYFPSNTASVYFYRCVLCRKSLIACSVKSQYATISNQSKLLGIFICSYNCLLRIIIYSKKYCRMKVNGYYLTEIIT